MSNRALSLTAREAATIQAALRCYQQQGFGDMHKLPPELANIAVDGDTGRVPLDDGEIDDLIQTLAPGPTRGGTADCAVDAGGVAGMEEINRSNQRLSEREAARYLGPISVRTLQDWRTKSVGPAYTKLGKRVAYAIADLDKYLASQRVEPKAVAS
ncbi:MAG: helix-turn-helix domain-containing protein [Pseudomonas sp.]